MQHAVLGTHLRKRSRECLKAGCPGCDLNTKENIVIAQTLKRGDFVWVKSTSEFRPGQDAMVVNADDGIEVSLLFGCDRFNRHPDQLGVTLTGLTEAWTVDELDLTEIAH